MFFGKKILPLILLLFVFSCAAGEKSLRKVPRSQRKGLMVLNFKNSSLKSRSGEFAPWEFGIPSMIMTDIESIGMFNIVSRERLKNVFEEQQIQMTGLTDPARAVKIGRIVSAEYLLSGSFIEMNGMLRIESRVFSVETGAQLGAAAVSGKTDTFFELEKKLVIKITDYLNAMLTAGEKSAIASKIETRSVDASLNNYRGELAVIKAENLKAKGKESESKKFIDSAKKSFQKAIQIDPEYEKARKNLSKISMAVPVSL